MKGIPVSFKDPKWVMGKSGKICYSNRCSKKKTWWRYHFAVPNFQDLPPSHVKVVNIFLPDFQNITSWNLDLFYISKFFGIDLKTILPWNISEVGRYINLIRWWIDSCALFWFLDITCCFLLLILIFRNFFASIFTYGKK